MRATQKAVVTATLLMGLSACSAQYRTHGYVPPEDQLTQIVPGVDNKASVEELVGTPSTAGVANDSGFYYVSSEVRHFAWRKPEVIDREILAITFDGAGIVDNIVTYGLEDGKVVPFERRVTKSGDGDINFIRKLFGNIGSINLGGLGG